MSSLVSGLVAGLELTPNTKLVTSVMRAAVEDNKTIRKSLLSKFTH